MRPRIEGKMINAILGMVLLLKRVITIATIQTNPKIPTVNSDIYMILYIIIYPAGI